MFSNLEQNCRYEIKLKCFKKVVVLFAFKNKCSHIEHSGISLSPIFNTSFPNHKLKMKNLFHFSLKIKYC